MTDEEFKSALANSFAGSDAKIKELADKIADLVETGKKTDLKIAELAELGKKNELLIADASKQIKENGEHIGGIDKNIGHHAEQFFQNVFAEKKIFGGIEYDDIILNMRHRDKSGEVEFDIVLENGSALALIEVKNRIRPEYVKKLAEERIIKFRQYFPKYKDFDVYLGMAGFSFSKAVLSEAKKYGVGIVRQAGKGIEVDATGLRAYPAC